MTPPENGKPLWDESRVERLLEQFFPREIPMPLRGANPVRVPRTQLAGPVGSNRAAKSRANSTTGGLMVGCTLALMLMVVVLLWKPASQQKTVPPQNAGRSSNEAADSQAEDRDNGVLEALKHDGQGPVELRPRIQAVGTDDPEGSPFPELDVEVFPLDGESPKRPGKSPMPTPQTPMPEEERELPESQPPAADPDEARLETMLPELRAVFPALGLD